MRTATRSLLLLVVIFFVVNGVGLAVVYYLAPHSDLFSKFEIGVCLFFAGYLLPTRVGASPRQKNSRQYWAWALPVLLVGFGLALAVEVLAVHTKGVPVKAVTGAVAGPVVIALFLWLADRPAKR